MCHFFKPQAISYFRNVPLCLLEQDLCLLQDAAVYYLAGRPTGLFLEDLVEVVDMYG